MLWQGLMNQGPKLLLGTVVDAPQKFHDPETIFWVSNNNFQKNQGHHVISIRLHAMPLLGRYVSWSILAFDGPFMLLLGFLYFKLCLYCVISQSCISQPSQGFIRCQWVFQGWIQQWSQKMCHGKYGRAPLCLRL